MTKKPRAPLPWEYELDEPRVPQYAPRQCKVIRSIGGPVVACNLGAPEADYIVHACNAYPKLVELLKKLHAASDFLGEFDWKIYRALKNLGELPAQMKTIALIDTRSEVTGVSLGILVSAHGTVKEAFAAK